MIAGLLLALGFQALMSLLDPGFWMISASLLEEEDTKNSDLRNWEHTGL